MEEETIAYWLDIVDYDLDTTEAMYQTGRWLYVGFMCHQVIEKILKAYWCYKRDDDPPYTHNHRRIAEGTGIWRQLTDEQRDFIAEIATYNIEGRYPRYKDELARQLTKERCRQMIDKTKEIQLWIREKCSVSTKPSASSDASRKLSETDSEQSPES